MEREIFKYKLYHCVLLQFPSLDERLVSCREEGIHPSEEIRIAIEKMNVFIFASPNIGQGH